MSFRQTFTFNSRGLTEFFFFYGAAILSNQKIELTSELGPKTSQSSEVSHHWAGNNTDFSLR